MWHELREGTKDDGRVAVWNVVQVSLFNFRLCMFFFSITPRLRFVDWTDLRNSNISLPCTALIKASWCLQLSALALFCAILLYHPTSVCSTGSLRTRKSYGSLSSTDLASAKQDLSFRGNVVVGGMHFTISQRLQSLHFFQQYILQYIYIYIKTGRWPVDPKIRRYIYSYGPLIGRSGFKPQVQD